MHLRALKILPYVAAWFVVELPSEPLIFQQVLKNYLAVALIFGSLSLLLQLLAQPFGRSQGGKPQSRRQQLHYYLKVLPLTVVFLGTLTYWQQIAGPLAFGLVLLLLALRSMLFRAAAHPSGRVFLPLSLSTETLTAILSFHLVLNFPLPLVYGLILGLPLASLITAVALAEGLTRDSTDSAAATHRQQRLRRRLIVLLAIAPVWIWLAVVGALLPRLYALTMLTIPAVAWLAARLKLRAEHIQLPPKLSQAATGISLLFIAMLLAATLIS